MTSRWISFLYAAPHPGVRHDPSVGRAEAYRLGIQAIRDGLGEDGFLLGDGSVPCTRNTLHTALSG